MSTNRYLNRFFEILPGALSWTVLLALAGSALWNPVACAVAIIAFDFYWIIRAAYLTTLLVMAHRQLALQRRKDWLAACASVEYKDWQDIRQLVIFPVYREGLDILRPSLQALKDSRFPKQQIFVVVAFEQRYQPAFDTAAALEKEFGACFGGYLTTFHPDALPGELRLKGANATWAAKAAREVLLKKGIALENVIVSCFDADTCVDKEYFGCLTYHFLTHETPHQASYQPIPVYNNNIWDAPSLARIIEISASFCQMIDSMRLEKFVTFSSHSMSFKTLVDIDYWPVDMISDDSVVYWKAFLHFNGDYHVVPLYTTVSMDAAYGKNFFDTIAVQYRQKRRWAWGVENFAFVAMRFAGNRAIPLVTKLRRSFQLLESHVTWAVWALIIGVIAPLPIFLGGVLFSQLPIGYNLPRVTGMLLDFTLITSLVWIFLSRTILPPRPRHVPRITYLIMFLEWIFIPGIILVLGSTPALDAQTRLLFNRRLEFSATEKKRKVV